MGEAMKWMLIGIATLASVAFALLNAWLLMKLVLTSMMRGSASNGKVESPLDTKRSRR
jgi:hypothetical protein